ncbi:hypothetical protein QVN42_04290 [Yersinia nurmii]|uniref:Uncharacterized protein n=1 Tax=Yersinia nurmii TaxID=685706 RepID=A0AAW7JY48_9GAMM|nr:hypothetical protein [Yersinia nurmii]MDN0086621.1 hypothetical protein [Yersinia nurmii]
MMRQPVGPITSDLSRMTLSHAWKTLARNIAADHYRQDSGVKNTRETSGELMIIRTDTKAIGFYSGDNILIKNADYLFYSLAHPITELWMKNTRPDGYDLNVLYNNPHSLHLIDRQMTEAMLYYVRRGYRVLVIYHGDTQAPEIAVQRAISLARRERHRVTLRTMEGRTEPKHAEQQYWAGFISEPDNRKFIYALFTRKKIMMAVIHYLLNRSQPNCDRLISVLAGFHIDWNRLIPDIDHQIDTYLYPWSGVYCSEEPRFLLCLLASVGTNKGCLLKINGHRVRHLRYRFGTLSWAAGAGNPHHGYLHFDWQAQERRMAGYCWRTGQRCLDGQRIVALSATLAGQDKVEAILSCEGHCREVIQKFSSGENEPGFDLPDWAQGFVQPMLQPRPQGGERVFSHYWRKAALARLALRLLQSKS